MAKLTAKQQTFCEEYLTDLNATQAAIRANYAANSVNVFRNIGCTNLMKPNVKAELARLKAITSEKVGISVEWVVRKLEEVALHCIQPETYDAGGANRALQLLGMHVGAFDADNKSKASVVRIFNLTQIQAILDEDKGRVKEIDGIKGGIAGEELDV